MIALLTTYLILAYILVPGPLFRVPASFFIKLRLFQLTKTEEVIFGCVVAVLPFGLAALTVWNFPYARNHPFQLSEANRADYRVDYRRTLTLIVAEDPARFLEPSPAAVQRNPYTRSLEDLGRRQLRFLSWFYGFIVIEGALFGFLTKHYGEWSDFGPYEWLARTFLLPRVSEWQLLLTDFAFPKQRKRNVLADVLCGDHLYRGRIGEYFLDKSGDLSGLLLKDVDRFQRKEYQDARDRAGAEDVDKEKFWHKIPGANFYVPAKQMTNLNLRFPYESSLDRMEHLLEFLKELGVSEKVTVEEEDPGGTSGASAQATAGHSDGTPETHRNDEVKSPGEHPLLF